MISFKDFVESSNVNELKNQMDDQEGVSASNSDEYSLSNLKKKSKKSSSCENTESDPFVDTDSVNEKFGRGRPQVNARISNYNLIVTFLRSKGLDPYKISKEQRKMWKQSPAFGAWKKINKYESFEDTGTVFSEEMIDTDQLKKKPTGSEAKVSKLDNKAFGKFVAQLIVKRGKTLTGNTNCDVIMIDPALNDQPSDKTSNNDRDV